MEDTHGTFGTTQDLRRSLRVPPSITFGIELDLELGLGIELGLAEMVENNLHFLVCYCE